MSRKISLSEAVRILAVAGTATPVTLVARTGDVVKKRLVKLADLEGSRRPWGVSEGPVITHGDPPRRYLAVEVLEDLGELGLGEAVQTPKPGGRAKYRNYRVDHVLAFSLGGESYLIEG